MNTTVTKVNTGPKISTIASFQHNESTFQLIECISSDADHLTGVYLNYHEALKILTKGLDFSNLKD